MLKREASYGSLRSATREGVVSCVRSDAWAPDDRAAPVSAHDGALVDRCAARSAARISSPAPPPRLHAHGALPRASWTRRSSAPRTSTSVDDLARLPLLDRATLRATTEARLSAAPPFVAITKTSSGTTGEPVTVQVQRRVATLARRDALARLRLGRLQHRHARDALLGLRAAGDELDQAHQGRTLDHAFKRDLYVDCTPRGDAALHRRGRASFARTSRT